MIEIELRRAAGVRATATIAACGIALLLAVGTLQGQGDDGVADMHTEPYDFQVAPVIGDEVGREAVAVVPATDIDEEPGLVVPKEVRG